MFSSINCTGHNDTLDMPPPKVYKENFLSIFMGGVEMLPTDLDMDMIDILFSRQLNNLPLERLAVKGGHHESKRQDEIFYRNPIRKR